MARNSLMQVKKEEFLIGETTPGTGNPATDYNVSQLPFSSFYSVKYRPPI